MPPVPPSVEPLLALLNTVDPDTGEDALAEPDGLARWLRERGLLPGPATATADDVGLAADLREGLRGAADVHREEGEPAPDADRLAAAVAALPVVLSADLSPQPAPGLPPVRAALAAFVCAVLQARLDGGWSRVKVCARDSCRWAFYDESRNRSGTWCSMAVCGNREKMRRRARRDGAER